MTIQEIVERNYNATVKRGLITNQTDVSQFINDIEKELDELKISVNASKINPFDPKELTDVVLVCFSMSKHFGYNIQKELESKTIYNETR